MRTTRDQFEILVNFMERNGDISKIKHNPNGKARISRLWEDLSVLLNNARTGNAAAVRTPDQWRKVWSDFKTSIRRKAEKAKVPPENDYYSIEARTLAIMNNDLPADMYSEAGDTDDADVKRVVDVRKALNLLSESENEDLVISDDDGEKELKIDFSIQNYSDQSYNLRDDDDVKPNETKNVGPCIENNTNPEKPKSKSGRKKKSKEQKAVPQIGTESCPLSSKPKTCQQNLSVLSNAGTEDVINNSKQNKRLICGQSIDGYIQTNNCENPPVFNSRDNANKIDNNECIDLVQNDEETAIITRNENVARNKSVKKKSFKNNFNPDNFGYNYQNDVNMGNIQDNTVVTPKINYQNDVSLGNIQDNRVGTPKNSNSDGLTKEGSLRQLLLNKLQKRKLPNQSQAFEPEPMLNFNNTDGVPIETEGSIAIIPNIGNNFENILNVDTPNNRKRPSPDEPPKPVQKRKRKVYSMSMDKEREERQFERELTMMKMEIMREEIQLKNRGLFMFQKFLHLAEQFFINNSVLK